MRYGNGYSYGYGTGYKCHRTYISANTVNITNVTSVTNVHVKRYSPSHGYGKHGHRNGHKSEGRHERPPALARFCASGGLLDYDKASRMGNSEMCGELVKVTSYAARGLKRSTGRFVGNAAGCVCDLAKCAGKILSSIFGD